VAKLRELVREVPSDDGGQFPGEYHWFASRFGTEVSQVFMKLGITTFGGPIAHLG
jgi:hypothetical protein